MKSGLFILEMSVKGLEYSGFGFFSQGLFFVNNFFKEIWMGVFLEFFLCVYFIFSILGDIVVVCFRFIFEDFTFF